MLLAKRHIKIRSVRGEKKCCVRVKVVGGVVFLESIPNWSDLARSAASIFSVTPTNGTIPYKAILWNNNKHNKILNKNFKFPALLLLFVDWWTCRALFDFYMYVMSRALFLFIFCFSVPLMLFWFCFYFIVFHWLIDDCCLYLYYAQLCYPGLWGQSNGRPVMVKRSLCDVHLALLSRSNWPNTVDPHLV